MWAYLFEWHALHIIDHCCSAALIVWTMSQRDAEDEDDEDEDMEEDQ